MVFAFKITVRERGINDSAKTSSHHGILRSDGLF